MSADPLTSLAGLVFHRLETLTAGARALGTDTALVADAANLRWLGASGRHGTCVLLHDGTALGLSTESMALAAALTHAGVRRGSRIAVDDAGADVVRASSQPGRPLADLAPALKESRLRKDDAELRAIERAADLATAGQRAVRAALVPGVREDELWAAAGEAMHALGGSDEAVVDLMGGARTALVGEAPTTHVVAPGDPVLFDLAPRAGAYWADSCATICCGTPSSALVRRHDAVRHALEAGLQAARPGVMACDVDAVIRSELERRGLHCPHHTGHGVGAAPQEAPWFVPGDTTVLDERMVIALEPGAYTGGFGVRLEHLAVVTEGGATPLTSHILDHL